MPPCRSAHFWLDTRPHMFAPGLLFGLTLAFYVHFLLVLASAAIFAVSSVFGAPASSALQFLSTLFVKEPGNLWVVASQLVSIAAYIFIAENILRAALDTAIAKPFLAQNAKRFSRAGFAAAFLAVLHFAGSVATKALALAPAGWGKAGFFLAALAAISFITLSSAFREGARLRQEQDLTV